MKIMVFDTETTGLPSTRIISPDTLKLWPHIVQFSYIIYDTSLNDIIESSDEIVNLVDEIMISEESTKIHGITNELCKRKGISISLLLIDFFYHLRNVDLLVGHNISFDINTLKVELLRMIYGNFSEDIKKQHKYNLHLLTNYKNICCTMQESIDLCAIKALDKFGKEYNKFPKLIELHKKLFETEPNNLHNSLNDILITLRCLMKIRNDMDLNKQCIPFMELVKERELL